MSLVIKKPTNGELILKKDYFPIPSLDLRFAETKSLRDYITDKNLVDHTRASSATYVGSDGLIKTATTNLLTYSEEFDTNPPWSTIRASITANATTAPNGTFTADKLIANTDNNTHSVEQTVTVSAGATYVFSVYAKAGELSDLRIIEDEEDNTYSTIDLINGTATGGGVVVNAGGGWFRCFVTMSVSGTTINPMLRVGNGSTQTFAGNNVDGIYVWGAQLEQSSIVGEYVKTTSTINSAPRFDHDPATGESLGLLVEESRTNLVYPSIPDDGTLWAVGTSISVTEGSDTAPDSTTTATYYEINSGPAQQFIGYNATVTESTSYTFSFYVKNINASDLEFSVLNLNVTVDIISATSYLSQVNTSSYTRVSVSFVTPAGCTSIRVFPFRGFNETGSFYLWGAQLEAGSFPTSYIPTEGSTVTRAADVASISGSNFSSWYRQDEGTVFNDSTVIAPDVQTQTVWSLTGGTYFTSLRQPQGFGDRFRAQIGNVFTPAPGAGDTLSAGTRKACVAYSGTAGRLQVGSSSDDVTASGVLDATQFNVGSLGGTSATLNGTINRLTYWNQRLSDSTLVNLTNGTQPF